MEKEQFVEQPEVCSHGAAAQNLQESKEIGQVAEGSTGKFKDSEALLEAYNNLQSEFTKKCQTLADLKKKGEENVHFDNLNQKMQNFFGAHPEAADFKEAILNQVSDDKLLQDDNPFERAFGKIAIQNFKTPNNLVQDESFLEQFVFKNDQIKERILNDYFSQVNFASSPKLISSHAGSAPSITPKSLPKNIVEAGKMAKAIFDGK